MFESFIGVNFWTALFVLLNTLLLFFVAKKYLFVPVKKMIDSRQQEIDQMYSKAGEAESQADALRSELEARLDHAQAESEKIVKEAVLRGQNREEEIIRQANSQAEAIRAKAAADIAQEKKKAVNEAKDEISQLAMSIAGKVMGKTLTREDQERLVEQFIEELGEDQ